MSREAKEKALTQAWENMTPNGRKRLCPAPTEDSHLISGDDSIMVVHLAGFDLRRGEKPATVSAVLTQKFGLAPKSIVNVSPMGPQLQELHIVASRIEDLRLAVSRTEGALKLSTKLDARLPPLGALDPQAITESNSRFCERINREITRLSKSNSRTLCHLADFLALYRDKDLRISAPRPHQRRQQFFASAFLDETVFEQSASAPTMVADKP
jgi:hypothetical protein